MKTCIILCLIAFALSQFIVNEFFPATGCRGRADFGTYNVNNKCNKFQEEKPFKVIHIGEREYQIHRNCDDSCNNCEAPESRNYMCFEDETSSVLSRHGSFEITPNGFFMSTYSKSEHCSGKVGEYALYLPDGMKCSSQLSRIGRKIFSKKADGFVSMRYNRERKGIEFYKFSDSLCSQQIANEFYPEDRCVQLPDMNEGEQATLSRVPVQ